MSSSDVDEDDLHQDGNALKKKLLWKYEKEMKEERRRRRKQERRERTPLTRANWLQRLFYTWVRALMWKGFLSPLEMDDLWELNRAEQTTHVLKKFNYWWNLQKKSNQLSAPFFATYSCDPPLIPFVAFGFSALNLMSRVPSSCVVNMCFPVMLNNYFCTSIK